MAKELFKADDPEKTRKALIKMFDESVSGKIPEGDVSMLIKAAANTNKKSFIAGTIEGLMSLGNARANFSGERMVYNYVKGISEGKDAEKAKAEAVEEEQVNHNPNRTEYTIGETYQTPRGLMEVIRYDETGNPVFKRAK